MTTPTPDELVDLLRARGMRVTPQRGQVLTAVRELGHATPEQISESVPGVDVTTVYRNLELLEELGLVRHAHLGHGAPSYRPAEDQHVHIVCHTCGSVLDAEPALVDELAGKLLAEHDFSLDRAHFTVFGRCGACTAAAEAEVDSATAERSAASSATAERSAASSATAERSAASSATAEQTTPSTR